MAEENQDDKTEEPSTHRIEEFRKRGEVASSKELTSILILSASILTLTLSLVYIYEELARLIEWVYALDVSSAFSEVSRETILRKTMFTGLKCLSPIFFASFCISIISNIIQVGFLFSPEVLKFKPERINPVAGLKKIFSMKSLMEALKGVFKFTIILSIMFYFIKDDLTTYSGFLHLNYFNSFLFAKGMIVRLLFSMISGLIVVAIFDFAYQKITYKKKLMQTKHEAKKELKEQEGNPEVKQRIRSIQKEMAKRRLRVDVPTADVIVTNPTHFSVALKYDGESMISPLVVAKGADSLAFRIREIAKEHDIPLVENVPLARSLYKSVDVGGSVPRDMYKAVAEVIAFVYKIKKKNKALS